MAPESRPLPRESIGELRPPREGFPYLRGASRFPFQPDALEFSAVNAWWLADVCMLAYGNAAFMTDAFLSSPLPQQGYQIGWLGTADDNRGVVLQNDSALIVAFRGTRLEVHSVLDRAELVVINQADLWTDCRFPTSPFGSQGRVHSGFLTAFIEIQGTLDEILSRRRPGQRLWLTGHSLGGALAAIASAYLGESRVQGLYTYGCPRVGNAAFTKLLPKSAHFRFVHGSDWVCAVPPEFLGYVHSGVHIQVPSSPRPAFRDRLAGDMNALLQALWPAGEGLRWQADRFPITVAGLADHAPIYYATVLWNSLVSTTGS
jgi:triacylglycerol lipase